MRISIGRIAVYLFSLAIIYLAGVYFGSFLYLLYIFFLVFPLLSTLFFILGYASIRCRQECSNLFPVKGDKVRYRFVVKNLIIFPILSLEVHFISVSPSLDLVLSDFHTSIPARNEIRREYEITCPYRGTYSVGIRELVVCDLLHFFALKRSVSPINFSVYPRVIPIDKFSPLIASADEGNASYGMSPQTALFYQLREYRDGEPVKHIYWKKYASTGKPHLKEYEATGRAGVRIYLDLRRMDDDPGANLLEQTDVSVETLVALVKYYLDRKVPAAVLAPGMKPFPFAGREAADFKDFYLSTPSISSDDAVSPAVLFQMDDRSAALSSQSVIIITHNLDPQLFSLSRSSSGSVHHILYIINSVGYQLSDKQKIRSFLDKARWQGADIVEVKNAESLSRDGSGRRYVRI